MQVTLKEPLSGIAYGYVNCALGFTSAPPGRVFSGRLKQSCESVEALSASIWRDFEAYPAVCESPRDCERWRECARTAWRSRVIYQARSAVHQIRLRSLRRPAAR